MEEIMNLDYKEKMRNYWGPAILGLFFFLWAVLSIYEFVFDLSLRTVPRNVFTWLGVGAIISFFVWLNIRIRRIDQQNKPVWIRILNQTKKEIMAPTPSQVNTFQGTVLKERSKTNS